MALSTIQLYTVGTTGLKSAATPLIGTTVQTDGGGNFNITGRYSCAALPATQVFITATGGNPGSGNNSALTLAAALGPCSNLTPSTFIQINEVTTVAAAYALAPFAADITHVGAMGSNPSGLVNAFTNAALLANITTGSSGGASLSPGVSVPTTEINTLGDILAACVNTTGAASSSCTTLFSATGATETFGAALAIARAPGAAAVTALYALTTPSAPFQPTMTSQPNDFSVAVTTTGGGSFLTPYGIAIDNAGNAWVTNEGGASVGELSTAGGLLTSATAPGLFGPQSVAIDRGGNVWVANTAGNSVIKFSVAAGSITATNSFTAGGIAGPSAIALDSAGNAFVANFNGNSVTSLTPAGVPNSGSPYTGIGNITVPDAIAVGPTGNVYVTSGNGSVVSLSNAGALVATLNDGTLQGPVGVAVDGSGRVAATGFTSGPGTGGAVSEFTSAGTAAPGSPATSGFIYPGGLATDGTSLWVANSISAGSLAQLSFGSSTPVSPPAGFGSLTTPFGVAVDASGCVWTTNSQSNTVSKFIGLAVPVTTPLAANVGP